MNFSRYLSRRTVKKKSERKGRRSLDTTIEYGTVTRMACEKTRAAYSLSFGSGPQEPGLSARTGCGQDGRAPGSTSPRLRRCEKIDSVMLRACDFFQFGRKVALKTKELSALKWPKIEKSHKL